MSSQTVYFTNPSEIAQIQQNLNFGQSINSSTALPLVSQYINTLKAAPAYGGGAPASQQGHKGMFFIGGNYLTNQTMTYFTGTANSQGTPMAQDTIVNIASQGKMLTGLVVTKMLEERLIKSSDRCSTYYPAMTGLGTYYNSIQLLDPVTFPYSASSWTGTTATFNWATITFADLLHFSIGLPNDFFLSGPMGITSQQTAISSIVQAYTAGCAQFGTGYVNTAGLAACIQMNTIMTNAINNTNPTLFMSLYAGYTGGIDNINTALNVEDLISKNRSGLLPAMFAPGSYRDLPYPLGGRGFEHYYDTGYLTLGVVLDKALRAGSYPNGFAQYAREKFFTPMGMNDTYVVGVESIPDSKQTRLAEGSWRRSPAVGGCYSLWTSAAPTTYSTFTVSAATPTTWASFGCSSGYANNMRTIMNAYTGTATLAAFAAPGYLAWDSEYPDDGLARVSKVYIWCKTGTASNPPVGNSPVFTTPTDWIKILQMIGNRGYYNNTRILKSESFNYFVSPKLNSLEVYANDAVGYGETSQRQSNSQAYCMGFYRPNRDINNRTEYGYDYDTLLAGGGTSVAMYIDLSTGNYYFMGAQELTLSSGTTPVSGVGSSVNNSTTNIPELIPRMIA